MVKKSKNPISTESPAVNTRIKVTMTDLRKTVALVIAITLILTISLNSLSFTFGSLPCNDGDCSVCASCGFTYDCAVCKDSGESQSSNGADENSAVIEIMLPDTPRVGPPAGHASAASAETPGATLSPMLLWSLFALPIILMLAALLKEKSSADD